MLNPGVIQQPNFPIVNVVTSKIRIEGIGKLEIRKKSLNTQEHLLKMVRRFPENE